MDKIDTQNFTTNAMLARLLTIQRNYTPKHDELINDRAAFDGYVIDQVEINFAYPETQKRGIVSHLSLFLLGNKDNQFSKLCGI